MQVKYIRSSSVGTYEMCPIKFLLSYGLGWQEYPHIKTVQGTIVHKVMELIAKYKKAQQEQKDYTDELVPIISHTIDLTTINIEHIIQNAYDYYIKQYPKHNWNIERYKETQELIYTALELNNGYFDPRNQQIIDIEKHFNLGLTDEWAKDLRLMGTIDLITELDKDTIEIVDYKTGQRKNWTTGKVKDYKSLTEDFQLRFYHLAATMLYPNAKHIFATIYYIKSGGPFTIPFDRSEIPKTIATIKEKYLKIAECERPKPKYGFHCGFCEFSKTTFENTDINPIVAPRDYKFTKKGQCMSKCDQVNYVMDYRSMDTIVKNMSKNNHDLGKYQAPGEV